MTSYGVIGWQRVKGPPPAALVCYNILQKQTKKTDRISPCATARAFSGFSLCSLKFSNICVIRNASRNWWQNERQNSDDKPLPVYPYKTTLGYFSELKWRAIGSEAGNIYILHIGTGLLVVLAQVSEL